MTPTDHNKTLCLIHGLIGILVLMALAIVITRELDNPPPGNFDSPPAARQMNRGISDAIEGVRTELYFLPIPLLQVLTAYGLLRRRPWGRILALIFSAFYVWVFPLGTTLAVYTWWFLHSEGGRRLYAKNVA